MDQAWRCIVEGLDAACVCDRGELWKNWKNWTDGVRRISANGVLHNWSARQRDFRDCQLCEIHSARITAIYLCHENVGHLR